MFRIVRLTLTLVVALLLGLAAGTGKAQAGATLPGFDLFTTDLDSTWVDLSPMGAPIW